MPSATMVRCRALDPNAIMALEMALSWAEPGKSGNEKALIDFRVLTGSRLQSATGEN